MECFNEQTGNCQLYNFKMTVGGHLVSKKNTFLTRNSIGHTYLTKSC